MLNWKREQQKEMNVCKRNKRTELHMKYVNLVNIY